MGGVAKIDVIMEHALIFHSCPAAAFCGKMQGQWGRLLLPGVHSLGFQEHFLCSQTFFAGQSWPSEPRNVWCCLKLAAPVGPVGPQGSLLVILRQRCVY